MQLAYHERNETGHDNAPAVVLLHGVFGRGRNLGHLARALAPKYRVYAFDLRNHGHSPHGPISYAAMVQDVLETMDHLEIERADVLGHSMGGKTAMMLALTAPERVNRLLVADNAPAPTHFGQEGLPRTLAGLKLPKLYTRQDIRDFLLPHAGTTAIADWLGQNLAYGEGGAARWTIGLHQIADGYATIQAWPEQEEGKHWDGPALFLRGETSPFVPPETWPAIRALFPRAQIETLPDAGHWLHVDQPQLFTEAMLNFFD